MVILWQCHLLILLPLFLEMIRQQDQHIPQGLTLQFKILLIPYLLQEIHRRDHNLEQQVLIPLIVILPILLGVQTQAHHTAQEPHGQPIPPGRVPNQSLSNQRKKSANNATVQATNNVGLAMALGR